MVHIPKGDGGHTSLPPCDPPLEIDGDTHRVLPPRGITLFRGRGGSGNHMFSIEGEGGEIDERRGIFVAGHRAGEVKVILTDRYCQGRAEARVTIIEGIRLVPERIRVRPGMRVNFRVEGGSGLVRFSIAFRGSGAPTINERGEYQAGGQRGVDLIRAEDMQSGASADAIVEVDPSASLTLPYDFLGIPLDSKVEPKANGGSQRLRWAVTQGTSVEVVEGHALRGMRTGRARLRGEDEFSGASLELTVEVGMRLNVDSTYAGDRSEATRILAHDLNGDGVDEAIVTMPLSNLHHLRAGAVLVYRGTSEGWHSPPAFVATGEAIDDQFGSSIAVGDVDGDGRKDLLVGAWQADQSGMNSGGVFLFKGADGDGFFQPRPEQSFAGIAGWDRLGASMVLCDLDGDRDLDLVMAAPDAESRDRRAQNQGALYVHPNVGGRLLGAAVQTIYGEIPEPGGGSRLHNDLRLGMRMASGDFNGDGRCDIALQVQRPFNNSNWFDGAVLLFQAAAEGRDLSLRLEERPILILEPELEKDGNDSMLGHALLLRDLDGDGKDELIVGQHRANDGEGGMRKERAGAVHIIRGQRLNERKWLRTRSDELVSLRGQLAYAELGFSLSVADADGDGVADLALGGPWGEASPPTMISRPGAVHIFKGRPSDLPRLDAPTQSFFGTSSYERFGWALALASPQRLLVYAGLADDGIPGLSNAVDTGRLSFFALSTPSPSSTIIPLPIARGGRRYGQSVVTLDFDADGLPDLLVGAPGEAFRNPSSAYPEFGAFHVYLGSHGDRPSWRETPS
ncbi:MAG: FG-GAP-like repeat-containing protein, partial [Sandaracinaceae bacterium]|nr:FG-GAP-like repeat-containing protein [Sandaracinaceae bacterium]